MRTALFRDDLEKARCPCGKPPMLTPTVQLHARCHPAASTAVEYHKASGVLVITCAACNRLVARVAIATHPSESVCPN